MNYIDDLQGHIPSANHSRDMTNSLIYPGTEQLVKDIGMWIEESCCNKDYCIILQNSIFEERQSNHLLIRHLLSTAGYYTRYENGEFYIRWDNKPF